MAESGRQPYKKKKPNIPIQTPVIGEIILSPEEQTVSFEMTASDNAKKAYKRIYSKCDMLFERGLDFKDLGDELRIMFEKRQWLDFASRREGEVNTTLVSEFYSVLSTMTLAELTESQVVPLRTRNITFNSAIINAILKVEVFPDNEDYRMRWFLDDATVFDQTAMRAQMVFDRDAVWVENRFNYGRCYRGLKAIKRFISHSLYPSSKHTAYGKEDICIAWAIVNDVKVDVGKLMLKRLFESIAIAKPGSHLYFPCFITELCHRSGVPFLPNDRLALADDSLIGPSLPRSPDGSISSLLRVRQPPPAPPVCTSSSIPSFSNQPQQTPFPNTITYEMFQSLVSDVAQGRAENLQGQANLALYAESSRQWCDDIRRGLRRHEQLLRDPTSDHPTYPPCQPDPYTLPQWIGPTPPPFSFHPMTHPFGSQARGADSFSTGVQRPAMSSWGGFADFARMTAGFSSRNVDSSVRTTTEFQPPVYHSGPSSSYQIDPEVDDEEE